MNVLIYAEHEHGQLKGETAKLLSAAERFAGESHVLVAGDNCQAVAEQVAHLAGVSKVLVAEHSCYAHQLAEPVSQLIEQLASDYDVILAASTTTGKNLLPRVAALLDVNQISDVIEIQTADTFVRPFYAGNAIATVKSLDSKKVLTIRTAAFDSVLNTGQAEIVSLDKVFENGQSRFIDETQTKSARPELTAADVIISGGRGMQSGENFVLLEGIADKLGAAIGASRAAVDAGFVPNDLQVGQTGKIVAPNLYIAVGISGAIQHLAGMKDSKIIVAINKDEDAPIFQVADYGLVGDLFEILPQLEAQL